MRATIPDVSVHCTGCIPVQLTVKKHAERVSDQNTRKYSEKYLKHSCIPIAIAFAR